MMCAGARVGFYGGDPIKMLKEDIPRLKPTVFAAVCRPKMKNSTIFGRLEAYCTARNV
jgi:hypothetical protein